MQSVDAEVNISVNMQSEVQCRRSGSRSKLLGHNLPFKPVQFIDRESSSSTDQGGVKSRDHAKTGSDDPEGVDKQVFDPKVNKAEAQFNRVRSSAGTGSSERRADSVQKSRKAPGRAKHFE